MIGQKEILEIILSLLGSLCFAVVFHIRGIKLVLSALGGGLSWATYLIFVDMFKSDLPNYVFAAIVASLFAEVASKICKMPVTVTLVPSIIPLLPGGNLYITMTYFVEGDYNSFSSFGLYTIGIAGAIALGIMAVSTAKQIIRSIIYKRN